MHYSYDWVTNRYDSGETLRFIFFWGHSNDGGHEIGKFVLSQWFEAPFTVDDIMYRTAEHWMMAFKARLFGDEKTFNKIVASKKPGEAKDLGRRVGGFNESVWNKRKYEIVKLGSIHKFNQNETLRNYLLTTVDRIIVEASPVDPVWGIGMASNSERIENPHAWKGQNLLGFALMETREFLRDFGSFNYAGKSLLPPWKKFPGIHPVEIFWRMGGGESYAMEFWKAYKSLSERDRKIYELSYPAMDAWAGFYESEWWQEN
jgi:ribA/ribD-fused uncharacterized protein